MSDPNVQLTILNPMPFYDPGNELQCEYLINDVDESEVTSVETSVMWMTEGKGDEDIGVHFFVRRHGATLEEEGINQWYRFTTKLPYSPLSYEGVMLKIRWCIRIRIFFRGGREFVFDRQIRLGNARLLMQESVEEPTGETARWRIN